MLALFRFIRQFILGIIATIVLVLLGIYYALNTPGLQSYITNYLNDGVFKKIEVQASLKHVTISVFPLGLSLQDVVLRRETHDMLCGGKPCLSKVSVGTLDVGVSLLTSYHKGEVVFSDVQINHAAVNLDYSDDGRLVLPVRLPNSESGHQEQSESLKPLDTYRLVRDAIPNYVGITDFTVTLGNTAKSDGRISFASTIKSATWRANGANDKDIIDITLANNALVIPLSDSKKPPVRTTIEDLSLIATIDGAGEVELREFKSKSRDFKANAKGKFKLTNDMARFPGTLKLNSTVAMREALSLVDFDGAGNLTFGGNITIAEKSGDVSVTGRAEWDHEARIDVYALHGGSANIKFSNALLSVSDLVITPQSGGQLAGNGTVDFTHDPIRARIKTKVEKVSFAALINGLNVATNAAEFQMSSEDLSVDFNIGDGGNAFDITVLGPILTENLIIPSMHSKTRTPIRSCHGTLKLFSDFNHLDMKGTKLGCNNGPGGVVSLPRGEVNYKTGATHFDLEAADIDFSNVEYFLMDNPTFFQKSPTAGTVSMRGQIIAQNASSPVVFTASLNGRDVRLYGVDYSSLSGDLLIDSEKVEGKSFKGVIGRNADGLIKLDQFYVRFDDETNALFQGRAEGDLRAFLMATQKLHEIPSTTINTISGRINDSPISVQLPFSPRPQALAPVSPGLTPIRDTLHSFLLWNVNADVSLNSVTLPNAYFKQIRAGIFCNKGACRKSKIRADGPYNTGNGSARGTTQIIADIDLLSEKESNISAKFNAIPLDKIIPENNFGGSLSGTVTLRGPWISWTTNSHLAVDGLAFNGNNLGYFQIAAATDNNDKVELRLEGFSGHLAARTTLPRSFSGPSRAFVTFNEIALEKLLSPQWRSKNDYRAVLDAEALMEGPAPFTPLSTNKKWYELWQIAGTLRRVNGQAKDFKFGLRNEANFSFKNETWEISPFVISDSADGKTQGLARLDGGGRFNIATKELNASTSLHLDLAVLPKLLPQFGTSYGRLDSTLQVAGKAPDLHWKGKGTIQQGGLLIQALPPTIRNMDLNFTFNDRKLEIDTFTGTKGEGKFDISGIVDWSRMITENDTLPSFKLIANFDNTQTRVPIPVLQSLDTEVSGELSLCRRNSCSDAGASSLATGKATEPIFLSGSIELREARVTRGLDCMDIVRAIPKSNDKLQSDEDSSLADNLYLNLNLKAPGTIALDTRCARAHLTSKEMRIEGFASHPQINGRVSTSDSAGTGQFGNIKFNIENAALEFDGAANNPRYNILLSTNVVGYREDKQRIDYKVFIQLDDRPQNKERAQPEIRAEPPVHPDGRRVLTQTDLVAMVITGRGPDASSPTSLSTEIVANEFATLGTNAIFSETRLENSVSRMFNRLSAGIVDRVAIDPLFESGRPKFRIRTIMEPVERVNVNVETDQDPAGTSVSAKNASLNAQWLLNNRINLGLDLRFQGEKVDTPLSMGAGILFRFGGD